MLLIRHLHIFPYLSTPEHCGFLNQSLLFNYLLSLCSNLLSFYFLYFQGRASHWQSQFQRIRHISPPITRPLKWPSTDPVSHVQKPVSRQPTTTTTTTFYVNIKSQIITRKTNTLTKKRIFKMWTNKFYTMTTKQHKKHWKTHKSLKIKRENKI